MTRCFQTLRNHKASGTEKPLFVYFALQNAHLGCGAVQREIGGVQAPCDTVDSFPKIKQDVYKGQAAFLAELDWGVGNVTDAFKEAGYWNNTVGERRDVDASRAQRRALTLGAAWPQLCSCQTTAVLCPTARTPRAEAAR